MSFEDLQAKDANKQTEPIVTVAWDCVPSSGYIRKEEQLVLVADTNDKLPESVTKGDGSASAQEETKPPEAKFDDQRNNQTRIRLGDDFINKVNKKWINAEHEKQTEIPLYKQAHSHTWDKFLRDLNIVHYATSYDVLHAPPTLREKGSFFHHGRNVPNQDYMSPADRANHIEDLHEDIDNIQDTLTKVMKDKYSMLLDQSTKGVKETKEMLPDLSASLDGLYKVTDKSKANPQMVHTTINAFCSDDNYNDLKDYFANSFRYIGERPPMPDQDTASNESQLAKRIESEEQEPRKK